MFSSVPKEVARRKMLWRQLKTIIGRPIDGRRPMKILIIGSSGMGKSCFGNSLITALQEYNEDLKHIEIFETGTYDKQKQVTLNLQRSEIKSDDICWPTIFDLVGFENEKTELIQEILLLILNGYIPNLANLEEIKEYGKNHGPESLRQEYSSYDESMRIDRIIFVASAAENEDLPLNFMDCVVAVAVPEKPHKSYVTRKIPLFGVLTKIDTVDQTGQAFLEKENMFKRRLGIDGSTRYGCCSAYCDKIYGPGEEKWSALPRLDVPILNFLIAVLSPSTTAAQDTVDNIRPTMTSTGSQTEQQIAGKTVDILSYLFRTAIRMLAFALCIGICNMYSPIQSKNLNYDCGLIGGLKNITVTEINTICKATKNNEITFIASTSYYQMLAIAFYLLFELVIWPFLIFLNSL